MKYLFLIVCILGVLTGCSPDTSPNIQPTWKISEIVTTNVWIVTSWETEGYGKEVIFTNTQCKLIYLNNFKIEEQ